MYPAHILAGDLFDEDVECFSPLGFDLALNTT